MKRLLPAPLLSVSILALWLVLNGSLGLGQWLLGLVLALVVPLATASLRPTPARIRKPWTVVRLILRVGRDVIQSNVVVARGVLRAHRHPPQGTFVRVPLELRDPHGLAALAAIMCVTPGTVWAELSLDRGALLLHVFNLDDEAAFIAHLQTHYERPLMEIFE
ncbi:Na+/H+ antiporter subunit E [Rhizobacter sp. Root1221]|uniref:Na+/H+ antiporter subunit E n=1 Tax=Rhizobacter sp. Root1221 TaxID=1736433 RepID=UPI0006FB928D|nr:Na+/H+ antiporter subunit E [Rhizobacter sp. Root1221]KQV78807.1 cation:proton antiporter [Rhizobacter sp. Root1221]